MPTEKRRHVNAFHFLWVPLYLVAALFLALLMEDRAAGSVTLVCASLALALGYLTRARWGILGLAASLCGLAVYTLTTHRVGFWALAFFAVWMTGAAILLMHECARTASARSAADFEQSSLRHLSMHDDDTNLRSMRAYLNDADIYMRLASRHNLGLVLSVFELEDAGLLSESIGRARLDALRRNLAAALRRSVRLEDMVYRIDDFTWGVLMITDASRIEAFRTRLLGVLRNASGDEAAQITMRYVAFDQEEMRTPIVLLERAQAARAVDE